MKLDDNFLNFKSKTSQNLLFSIRKIRNAPKNFPNAIIAEHIKQYLTSNY